MSKSFKNPLITIGMTTYKRPDLLREAVQSVLSQEYKNFRLIIGNDNPLETVSFESLNIEEDSRVEILNYKKNIGEVRSMNFMLSMVRSEWFSWLADDDVLHPQFISKFIEITKNNKKKDISAILCDYIEAENSINFTNNAIVSEVSKYYEFESFFRDFFSRKIKIIGVYGFLKTEVVKEIGGLKAFVTDLPYYGDTGFLLELLEKGTIIFNQSQLFLLRRHDGSVSSKIENITYLRESQENFLKTFKPFLKNKFPGKEYNQLTFLLINWFINDNLGVALSVKNNSKILSILKFSLSQNKLIFQMKPLYSIMLIFSILFQLTGVIFKFLRLKFIR
jgi:glycosyltransferase involved in cell wall biosynthesis